MGLHTGEAVERDDYFGPTVNRTARIMALAHGGQVLLSTNRRQTVSGDGRVTPQSAAGEAECAARRIMCDR